MPHIDVFNGDADGICALHQLRLAEPAQSTLVTGVKRDISLLERVEANRGDEVTVLDISMDKNKPGMIRLLERGARVQYFDHHFAGDIPDHPHLCARIDTSPETCTSLLVDEHLRGRHRPWAVVAAFGDNLDGSARQAAETLDLDDAQLGQLRELGIYVNYNAYGATLDDLHFPPGELFLRIQPYRDPFAFIEADETFAHLRDGYAQDIAKTDTLSPEVEKERCALYVLPAESWARRVSGVFGNRLSHDFPHRAHALLTRLPEGGYLVSVRAPKTTKTGADELCRQFPTGGGRQAAAGINKLPDNLFDEFASKFTELYA